MNEQPSPKDQALSDKKKADLLVDHKAWAKRIVERSDQGETINFTVLKMARAALGKE